MPRVARLMLEQMVPRWVLAENTDSGNMSHFTSMIWKKIWKAWMLNRTTVLHGILPLWKALIKSFKKHIAQLVLEAKLPWINSSPCHSPGLEWLEGRKQDFPPMAFWVGLPYLERTTDLLALERKKKSVSKELCAGHIFCSAIPKVKRTPCPDPTSQVCGSSLSAQ